MNTDTAVHRVKINGKDKQDKNGNTFGERGAGDVDRKTGMNK